MKKYKMTGCARFFIFMIIFLPALYFGVSFYNGEDGWQNIKDLIGIESNQSTSEKDHNDVKNLEDELAKKDQTIQDLQEENRKLKEELKNKENDAAATQ